MFTCSRLWQAEQIDTLQAYLCLNTRGGIILAWFNGRRDGGNNRSIDPTPMSVLELTAVVYGLA
ncbi:predicted protein [Chaetomium globosum CBS 148.51]|uniref:Uncharacterized protein n=1 Tax=Chaetomium globosum (strain ATCC 6205 / CBS 148.51 / DSM 1962 / NBRC 6347 / NRRL 1970) TaxID=306901 RepID=Q2GV12_CHAGB|nr:uncharacterized protein CHGG_08192 [Chaetomium globosum CBS 148.51]EAQ86939.1 predicted protein [Chaetomium globosum CBS 148.51]